MTDYSRECRKIAGQIAELTGHNPYSGFSSGTYHLETGYVRNGAEAVAKLTEQLNAAKQEKAERDAAVREAGSYVDHSACVPAAWGTRTHNHQGIPGAWLFPGEAS